MRDNIGRALCFGLGLFYMIGAVPLFTFGESGKKLWAFIQAQVTVIADAVGIAPWLAIWFIGTFAIAGPLALVWLIAGKGVSRIYWFLAGVLAYIGYWIFLSKAVKDALS